MKIKLLIFNIALSLGGGALVSLLIPDTAATYAALNLPVFAPAGYIFPIVWTILYLLIGVSGYLIMVSDNPNKDKAIKLYFVQLLVNFLWPFFFFTLHVYLFSFFWIILLWLLVFYLIFITYDIDETASYLLVPYLLWITFASILNICIYYMN
ncbi:MAG: TspO/MBR family protein [Beduini sp.]|uniref:TspO/MBR family protein n=1 Tax=Beduini sp. TaxID=1922300 RepID=UPI0039A1D7B9